MAEKFDKFTDRARKVLTLAQEEAQRFNHNYIGTEHLLLALFEVEDGTGPLHRAGVNPERFETDLAQALASITANTAAGDDAAPN